MARMAKALAVACLSLASPSRIHKASETTFAFVSMTLSVLLIHRSTQLEKQWTPAPTDYPHRAVHDEMYTNLEGSNRLRMFI
jgi:hypothetical protein